MTSSNDGVVIPLEQLSPAALGGIIDEFITREGTEYGWEDVSIDDKRAAVRAQLTKGEVVILFDPKMQTVNLALARDLPA